MHRKGHHEDDENCPPSHALPHLPRSASPPSPSDPPSPEPLSAEDETTDEEVTISIDTRDALFPEGKEFCYIQCESIQTRLTFSHFVILLT